MMGKVQLSSDILTNIFVSYEETPKYPLENLLLVSQLWQDAALRCKDIWSKFNIEVLDGCTAVLWSRRIPRRLGRSGPASPIAFSWRRNSDSLNTTCDVCKDSKSTTTKTSLYASVSTLLTCEETVLRAIMGDDGSLCERWHEISIRTKGAEFPKAISFFSHPTPRLVSMTLEFVIYWPMEENRPFLPSADSLQEFQILDCHLPCLPNLAKCVKVCFKNTFDRFIRQWMLDPMNAEGLRTMQQVLHLELRLDGALSHSFELPKHLPFLESLSLEGDKIPTNMKDVKMQRLKELTVKFSEPGGVTDGPILDLVQCEGIPFHQIDTLGIMFDGRSNDLWMTDDRYLWDNYRTLFCLCSSAKKIKINRATLLFIARLLDDDCSGNGILLGREFTVFMGFKSQEIRAGKDERARDIKAWDIRAWMK